ncbi:MAG: IS256 family transposase [Actinomycetota bacterium]|nr:IS256 family transposase [Actinomycetota bacterium]
MRENIPDETARVVDHVDDTGLSCLPDEVVLALADIGEVAREGLLALSVATGLAVLGEMMEAERTVLCGPRDAKDPDRRFERNGTAPTSVVLGGRKIPIRRPRVNPTDGSPEPQLESFVVASSKDLLTQVAMERMLAGVSARKYRRVNEPMGHEIAESASGESKSSVSRRFVSGTGKALGELLGRDLSTLEVAVLMIDGVDFADQTCVVAMVITVDGTKIPVGLRHGDTENKTLVTAMLVDLVDRGLDYSGGLLVVIDGAKALATAVRKVFGDLALIARCQLHKYRNVEGHLPKTERSRVRRRLAEAFNHPDPDQGLANARRLATELDNTWPDAAGSIREGLEDMFTVRRLGVAGTLLKTLMSTNPIESMISIARTTTSNVKRWRDGEMRRRWCAAGMLEAEKSFRRVKGHRQIPALVAELRAHAETVTPSCNTGKETIAA